LAETLFDIAAPDEHPHLRQVEIAEIADIAFLSRQAVTNMWSRDPTFPAPLAELSPGTRLR
jgi:hypothetical protein